LATDLDRVPLASGNQGTGRSVIVALMLHGVDVGVDRVGDRLFRVACLCW